MIRTLLALSLLAVPALAQVPSTSTDAAMGQASLDSVHGHKLFLRAQWGNLSKQPEGTLPRQWEGFLSATRGHADLLALIAAEPGDHPLPGLALNVAQFTSTTAGHSDGAIFGWHLGPAPLALPTYATFFTQPFTETWTVPEVAQLNRLEAVDPSGNLISMVGLSKEPGRPAGFASGPWNLGAPGLPGVFNGPWTSPGGEPLGQLHGVWTPGANPMEGQVSGVVVHDNGVPLAALQGVYSAQAEGPGGIVHGIWTELGTGAPLAGFRGNYIAASEPGEGFFQFAWTSFEEPQ